MRRLHRFKVVTCWIMSHCWDIDTYEVRFSLLESDCSFDLKWGIFWSGVSTMSTARRGKWICRYYDCFRWWHLEDYSVEGWWVLRHLFWLVVSELCPLGFYHRWVLREPLGSAMSISASIPFGYSDIIRTLTQWKSLAWSRRELEKVWIYLLRISRSHKIGFSHVVDYICISWFFIVSCNYG